MKKVILLTVCVWFVVSSCVMNKLDSGPREIRLERDGDLSISMDIGQGPLWSTRMQAGPFIFNVLPQLAIWLEDENGEYLDTLYVTGADFKKLRHAAKDKDGEAFFRENLPLWSAAMEARGEALPSKGNPLPDSLTSATPMGSFTLDTAAVRTGSAVRLFLEINKSGDYNDVFTKENSGTDGQPPIVYSAELEFPPSGKSVLLEPVGRGTDSGLLPDLSGIDTALQMIEAVSVKYGAKAD